MFNNSNGFSKDFYLWLLEEIWDSGLVYHSYYFEPTLGVCCSIWEDPFLMLSAGREL